MRNLLNLLTLLCILAHAIWGCCAHSTCSPAEPQACFYSTVRHSTAACCRHLHAPQYHEGESASGVDSPGCAPRSPIGHHCAHAPCQWIADCSSSQESWAPNLNWLKGSIEPCLPPMPFQSASGRTLTQRGPLRLGVSLRLHLALGVLQV
jgi:hypothetical protein